MPPTTTSPAARPRLAPLPLARWARWLVSLAGLALIGTSLGSYFYLRRQMEAIAARHLRLVVVGPNHLEPGAGAAFILLTTGVTGEPLSVPIEWSLSTSDGKLVDRKEPTDGDGRLVMNVPAEMSLPSRPGTVAQLGVIAGVGESAVNIMLPLSLQPPQYRTFLASDRRSYRPGDTVYYRSLTVDRHNLFLCRTLPLEFEILDAKSSPLADSQWAGLTDHGAGNGSFRLPVSLKPGTYTLVARGSGESTSETTSEQRLQFEVTGAAATEAPPKAAAVKNGGKKAVRIDFFPEGGALAAGLENRVYFFAHDDQGQPMEIHGTVVNDKGDDVSNIETSRGGRGKFSFAPIAAAMYRVKISNPPGIADSPSLPVASSAQEVAVDVAPGVIAPSAPLEVTVRAAKGKVPLVLTAFAGNLPIGQQLLVTPATSTAKATSFSIPLGDSAAGVIRLKVFDCSKSPPAICAERLVFRQPRRLAIRALPPEKLTDDLRLLIQDGKGQPAAATVAITVLGRGKTSSASAVTTHGDLMHALLADDLPDMASIASADLSADGALELVLGCQSVRAHETMPRKTPQSLDSVENVPLIFDNLNDVRAQYETALSTFHVQRTEAISALVMLSFFGGLALAILVAMLALLRAFSGGQIWLPVFAAVLCCAVVSAVANVASRVQSAETSTVAFASSGQPPQVSAASKPAKTPSDGPLRRLAEKLAKFGPDSEELKADRFPVQQYTALATSGTSTTEHSGKPLAWYPLLKAGQDGHVVVPGISAEAAANLRFLIEAVGGGRIESCEITPNR